LSDKYRSLHHYHIAIRCECRRRSTCE
jgi:hypothetical protein